MLLEPEAQRFADALDDYEHVSVADIGGTDESGYWLVVHDHRFDIRYLIDSHADYWDFIVRHAVGRPADAATSAEFPPAIGSSAATLAARA
jgi:hypothetical protein